MAMMRMPAGVGESGGVTLTGVEYTNFQTVVGDHKGMVVAIYRGGAKATLTYNSQTVTEIKDLVSSSVHLTIFTLTDVKDGDTLTCAGSLVYGVYVD